ncbi:hypothetical protein BT96DRAFT_1025608 [Gymnopus androsaceus JB14]|uniref:Uncharacterized protein n=1 Tax=Gymnopus androsaceus JB14 TaxID=1447944 RepID=A0A6A4GRU4_9AGAR|nr:hypothetical protein BT96DRAFT_1025608 [Gymnopus androsaceus JB14]
MSSDKVGILDVNFVADLVRQQGEELLRVRKELELTKKINTASFEALRATERHLDDFQQSCSQWHLRFSSIIGQELVALQTENDSMASQLEAARADLRTALGFTNLSESSVEPEQLINDRVPSLSTSIAVALEESDSDGYTSISFSDIDSSGTSSAIGRPCATNCPIPNCATSDDSLEVDPCGLDYAASAVSQRNRDGELEKVLSCGTEIVISAWSDKEAMRIESRASDADKNETQPILKYDSSETVDLHQQNGNVAVTLSTKQLMSEFLDGIPCDTDHLVWQCLTVESLKPVCSKLPKPMKRAVNALCLEVIGPVTETHYHVLRVPETLLAYPNINNRTLITVSKSANDLSCNLAKLKSGWKGHVLLQNSSAGELYYLGEYESGGSCRMAYSEYDLLPEETKLYLFNFAKALRRKDIQTNAQMALNMSKDTGIYIAKTELRLIGYNAIIENQLGKEAKQRKYV